MPPKTKKNEDARARAQARREQLRRQERNRRLGLYGLWSGLGVVVVVVVLLFTVVFPHATKNATKDVSGPISATLAADLSTIPASAFSTVGVTGAGTSVVGLKQVNGTSLTKDGKPTFVYVGAEFCPYCAAERWSIVAALSRFGGFSGLQTTQSSGTDTDPNTATLTFATAKYTSQYLTFDGAEAEDRAGNKLQTPDATAQTSWETYGKNAQGQLGFPYFSINDVYTGGYQYDPAVLKGMTADQIAAALKDPTSTVAKNALVAANILTAGICATTKDQPSAVCTSAEVTAAKPYLSSAGSSTGSPTGG